MSRQLYGNTQGLAPKALKKLEKLVTRKISSDLIVSNDLARELCVVSEELNRKLALIVDRRGKIEMLVVGTRDIVYLPDLGRYRIGRGRLRRLRLIVSDLGKHQEAVLTQDLFVDLEKLRFDLVAAVKLVKDQARITYAWNLPRTNPEDQATETVENQILTDLSFNFTDWIADLESELESKLPKYTSKTPRAFVVGVYADKTTEIKSRILELKELARTAGVDVVGEFTQIRKLDPKTLLGKGKLEQILIEAIRYDANLLIFDAELSPSQWRSITNATELKVIDRSMLILDIFAQHATSRDGKLQVELAQLRYNLPKLVEKDVGLSRLTGGIGGRGPGETKLEVSRRYYRDRIRLLERDIDKLSRQRHLRRKKRVNVPIPLVALVGYTNVGKSSLFNALTSSDVKAENKLFATLDPTQRRLFLENPTGDYKNYHQHQAVLIDTVGFIRELPKELVSAFRATLEEINNACLLLHVHDASDPEITNSHNAVLDQLKQSHLDHIEVLNVINKTDLVVTEQASELSTEFQAIPVSAEKKVGLNTLVQKINFLLKSV